MDYNASAAGGSNLSPTNPEITKRATQILAHFDLTPTGKLPADLVTASGSGLDPHITLAAARIQVARVAAARGLPEDDVRALVERASDSPTMVRLGGRAADQCSGTEPRAGPLPEGGVISDGRKRTSHCRTDARAAEDRRRRGIRPRLVRGKLKLFFGYAAGVGKTYSMLQEARRLAESGADIVVGYVEPHGRPETEALLEGLEVLPPLEVTYRGAWLREFDLDAALARKPELILVDELAHTNAPGCRHVKRWQDVEELLAAGIDVHATCNVQHVESLNDVIAQASGVVVRETVPDDVINRADELALIDLTPDDLLERLKEGKVYIAPQAERALQNFFRKENLVVLRELALRRAAERVHADVQTARTGLGCQGCLGDARMPAGLRGPQPHVGQGDPRRQTARQFAECGVDCRAR